MSEYRDYTLAKEYGIFTACHKDYDASWEGEENGWVGSPPVIVGRTLDEVRAQIDDWHDDAATVQGG